MADPFLTRKESAAWLGIDPTDTEGLALLPGLISAVTQALIDVMNGDPRTTEYSEWRNGTGAVALPVRYNPISSVTKVLIDGKPTDPAEVTWDDVLVYRRGYWPRGKSNIRITYQAGLDDLPAAVRQAALFTLKAMYEAREVSMNATGESFNGVLNQQFWQTGPGSVPPAAMMLLKNYINRFFP